MIQGFIPSVSSASCRKSVSNFSLLKECNATIHPKGLTRIATATISQYLNYVDDPARPCENSSSYGVDLSIPSIYIIVLPAPKFRSDSRQSGNQLCGRYRSNHQHCSESLKTASRRDAVRSRSDSPHI